MPSPTTASNVTTASIADDIDRLAHADQSLAVGLDGIVVSRVRVCPATAGQLKDLLEIVRVRCRLQRLDPDVLDPDVLRAGGALWLARRATSGSDHAAH